METPIIDHLSSSDYLNVYEPSQDSFLLLDALESDLAFLEDLEPRVCVEIGSGSGIIITALAKKLRNSLCLATDINIHACRATKRTSNRNSVNLDAINCNLIDVLRPGLIDLMIFNPPYVVTSDAEQKHGILLETRSHITFSWAGGKDGRNVINKLLLNLDSSLSPIGVLYLLLLRDNNPDDIIKNLEVMNFNAVKLMERRIPGEYLYVLKVTRHAK